MRPFLLLALVVSACLFQACGDGGSQSEPPRTSAGAPPDFVGVVSEDVFVGDAGYRSRTLARQREAGVRLIRQTFHWKEIETQPGHFEFGRYDAYVAELARRKIRILPILFDPPTFRASGPKRGTYPPKDPKTMGAFAAALVRRYGPDGSFWREHDELKPLPIRSWQVWNEPNLPPYWPSGPDPAEYTRLLRVVADAIRDVDSDAEVVTAGLPESRLGIPFKEYVEGMEKAGAKSARAIFALHPFAADAEATVNAVAGARKLLESHGDPAPIWVTEIGWASGGPSSPFTVGERGQADRIRATIRRLGARRRELGVRGVVYYDWKDSRVYPGGENFFGLHTGLLRLDGRAKPALDAFRGSARAIR